MAMVRPGAQALTRAFDALVPLGASPLPEGKGVPLLKPTFGRFHVAEVEARATKRLYASKGRSYRSTTFFTVMA